jgi:proteasome accessory factor B
MSKRRIPFADMAQRRQERLVSLFLMLTSSRQFITAEQIRRSVVGYEDDPDARDPDEAFKRSFERDKAELRDIGIEIEVGVNQARGEEGYRVRLSETLLPPIEFTAEETAALALAARLWGSASVASDARNGLMKLRAAGVEISEDVSSYALVPAGSDPAFAPLWQASRTRQVVQFKYTKPREDSPGKRTLEPWGVLQWRGRGYVVGHDRDRGEMRSFRMDRIEGEVTVLRTKAAAERPADIDFLEAVRGIDTASEQARVRVAPRRAAGLRRLASDSEPDGDADVLTLDYRNLGWLAGQIAAAGADATALQPPELVKAVSALLAGAAGGAR